MSEMSETYAAMREQRKAHNEEVIKFERELVQHLSEWHDFDFILIQPWHFRMVLKENKVVDYFPTKKKGSVVGSNQWFKIKNIERYIENHFKTAK